MLLAGRPSAFLGKEEAVQKNTRVAPEHMDAVRTLGRTRGWSKQKIKSIRGQVLALPDYEAREDYLKKLIRRR